MNDKPKLTIFNRDGSTTEVVPNKLWEPCKPDSFGRCSICGQKMGTAVHDHTKGEGSTE